MTALEENRPVPKKPGFQSPFRLAVLFSTFLALLTYLGGIFLALSDITELGGKEDYVLYGIQKLLLGRPLYTDPREPPFDFVHFTPLYYYLCAGVAKILGIVPGDAIGIARLARLTSIAFSLLKFLVLFRLATRILAIPPLAALLLCAMTSIIQAPIHFLGRPDALASLVMTIALYLAFAGLSSAGSLAAFHLALAGVLSSVAIFCKQNGIQLPVLLVMGLLLSGEVRKSMVATVGVGTSFFVLWEWLRTSYGEAFLLNAILSIEVPFVFRSGLEIFRQYFLAHAWIVGGATLLTLGWIVTPPSSRERWWGWLLLGMLLFAMGTSLRWGAAVGYFHEFTQLALLALFYFFCHWRGDGPSYSPETNNVPIGSREDQGKAVLAKQFLPHPSSLVGWLFLGMLLCSLPFFGCLETARLVWKKLRHPEATYAARKEAAQWLRHHLRPGEYILALDAPMTNLLPDVVLAPQPELALFAQSRLDFSRLRDLVAAGRVPFWITDGATSPTPYLGANSTPYRPRCTFGPIAIFTIREEER